MVGPPLPSRCTQLHAYARVAHAGNVGGLTSGQVVNQHKTGIPKHSPCTSREIAGRCCLGSSGRLQASNTAINMTLLMVSNVSSAASQCTCIVMKVAMFLDFKRLIPDQEDPASLVLQSHAACIPKDVACDQMSNLGYVPCCYDVLTLHLPAISMQRQPPHAVISPLEI